MHGENLLLIANVTLPLYALPLCSENEGHHYLSKQRGKTVKRKNLNKHTFMAGKKRVHHIFIHFFQWIISSRNRCRPMRVGYVHTCIYVSIFT